MFAAPHISVFVVVHSDIQGKIVQCDSICNGDIEVTPSLLSEVTKWTENCLHPKHSTIYVDFWGMVFVYRKNDLKLYYFCRIRNLRCLSVYRLLFWDIPDTALDSCLNFWISKYFWTIPICGKITAFGFHSELIKRFPSKFQEASLEPILLNKSKNRIEYEVVDEQLLHEPRSARSKKKNNTEEIWRPPDENWKEHQSCYHIKGKILRLVWLFCSSLLPLTLLRTL